MKTKLICLLLCLCFSYTVSYGKGDANIAVQNATFLNNSNNNYYYGFTAGNIVTLVPSVLWIDAPFGFYSGPADSVYWFYNGNQFATTYGAQSIQVTLAGTYSIIGYYTYYPLTSHNVILTNCTVTCSTASTSISGSNSALCNVTNTYTATNPFSAAAAITWTAPNYASIISGQGTLNVQIRFNTGFTFGNVTVRVQDGCCISNATIPVQGTIGTLSAISGPSSVCKRQHNVPYSVSPVAGVNYYSWAVPNKARIVAGAGTNSIIVNFDRYAGNVSVHVGNSCGTSLNQSIPVVFVCRESLDEDALSDAFIYPNPSADNFTLQMNPTGLENCSLIIHDISGREVERWEKMTSTNFSFGADLPAGYYVAEITQAEGKKFIKLVKR